MEGIGLIADAPERRHIALRAADLYLDHGTAPDLADAAGLILMGGPMSANDDLPWRRHEIGAIQQTLERGIPVWVCAWARN